MCQDSSLRAAVSKYHYGNWSRIAECLPGRIEVDCHHRWNELLVQRKDLKGKWKPMEDDLLLKAVWKFGEDWFQVAKVIGRPCSSCRERYTKWKIPENSWTPEEDSAILLWRERFSDWELVAKFVRETVPGNQQSHPISGVGCRDRCGELLVQQRFGKTTKKEAESQQAPPSGQSHPPAQSQAQSLAPTSAPTPAEFSLASPPTSQELDAVEMLVTSYADMPIKSSNVDLLLTPSIEPTDKQDPKPKRSRIRKKPVPKASAMESMEPVLAQIVESTDTTTTRAAAAAATSATSAAAVVHDTENSQSESMNEDKTKSAGKTNTKVRTTKKSTPRKRIRSPSPPTFTSDVEDAENEELGDIPIWEDDNDYPTSTRVNVVKEKEPRRKKTKRVKFYQLPEEESKSAEENDMEDVDHDHDDKPVMNESAAPSWVYEPLVSDSVREFLTDWVNDHGMTLENRKYKLASEGRNLLEAALMESKSFSKMITNDAMKIIKEILREQHDKHFLPITRPDHSEIHDHRSHSRVQNDGSGWCTPPCNRQATAF